VTGAFEAKAAKKKQTQRAQPTKDWGNVQFVKCDLDDKMRSDVKERIVPPDVLLTQLTELVDSGYKVSFGYEKRNDCVGVYATMPDETHHHHGMCLSARGPDVPAALKVLLYKHYVLLDAHWGNPVERDFEANQWG